MGAFETDAITGLRDFWRRLLARPDALMLELGAGGELLVARLRAVLSLLLLSMPLINLLTGGKYSETMIGLFGVVMAVVMSQVWLALARHRQRYRWLPWVTATYDVSLTTQGEQVLALALQQQPDLILLDVVMPGINGYDVCRQLKADPQTRDIIQNVYIRRVEKVGNELRNVQFDVIPNVKDPVKAAMKK